VLMKGLLNFFLGYVVIRVDGPGVEKLLNLAIARGILFWDIHYAGDKAVFKTYPDNFPLLRPLSRKAGCSLKIQRKVGFPFLYLPLQKEAGPGGRPDLLLSLPLHRCRFHLVHRGQGIRRRWRKGTSCKWPVSWA
jgi:hypothetical protein